MRREFDFAGSSGVRLQLSVAPRRLALFGFFARAPAAVIFLFAVSGDASAQTYSFAPGEAKATTGGAIAQAGDQQLHLSGIDAPELDQICTDEAGKPYPCGLRSRDALAALLAPGATCTVEPRDRFKRNVVTCYAGTTDINAEMVRRGQALAYRDFDGRRYSADEARAKRSKLGLHAGSFMEPDRWRSGERW